MQDLEGHILAWNRGAERLYGYSEAEALEMNIRDLVPEGSRAEACRILEAVERGEEVRATEAKRTAGEFVSRASPARELRSRWNFRSGRLLRW